MTSDIMELYALFDEQSIIANLQITYAILTLWSVSFLQFVPVLIDRQTSRVRQEKSCCTDSCKDHCLKVLDVVMALFLQDGSFLCLRLYIMIKLKLITFSLVFFVLKNILTVIILIYRFGLLVCCRHPGRDDDDDDDDDVGSNKKSDEQMPLRIVTVKVKKSR